MVVSVHLHFKWQMVSFYIEKHIFITENDEVKTKITILFVAFISGRIKTNKYINLRIVMPID